MSWNRRIKVAVILASLILASLLLVPLVPTVFLFYSMTSGMHTGQRYMDSLTDVEIQRWIDRTKDYLAHVDPNEYPIDARPVPSDLETLDIRRIDLWPDRVVYVWVGGLDHTALIVRKTDRGYMVVAQYNDYHSRVIWPKSTNE